MKIENMRKEALLWGIFVGSERIIDHLMDWNVEVSDVQFEFYVTVNGVPACIAERALSGSSRHARCEHTSLHQSIANRNEIKAAFPGAVVAVIAGQCPEERAVKQAA